MNGLQDIFKNCNLNNINFNNIITDKTLSSNAKKIPMEILFLIMSLIKALNLKN